MSINKIGSNLIRPLRTDNPKHSSTASENDSDELKRVERADRVEISDRGRELAAGTLESGAEARASREPVQGRIDSGFYNDPAVVEKVASRLIASGDLDILS